jgi:hypothetical protein
MFTDVQLPVRQGWEWGRGEARIPPAAPTPLTLSYTLLYIYTVHELCSQTIGEYRLWNIKSAPASPGRSRVGPALNVFRLLEQHREGDSVSRGGTMVAAE